jgi:hypothetical protein
VDPLARKYPWNSPYAFAENDVVSSVELEGLERWQVNASISMTFGVDSRLRGLGYLNIAVGASAEIPLGKETGLMIAHQWTWRTQAGGPGGIGLDEKVGAQMVVSTAGVLGTGNAPEMPLPLFHSRMTSSSSVLYKYALMVSSNYVMYKDWDQRVIALGVRVGDFMVSTHNDFFVGLLEKWAYRMVGLEPPPAPDEGETGGAQVSAVVRGWPGGIRTISAGTDIFTSPRIILYGEELTYEKKDRTYYRVYWPEQNIGWWWWRVNGEWSHGYWTVGGYLLGGEAGMFPQNKLHDWLKNPRYESLHRPGLGLMGGFEQRARTGL